MALIDPTEDRAWECAPPTLGDVLLALPFVALLAVMALGALEVWR